MLKAFPKIFTIGQNYIIDIFKEPVEVTEKLDGSQFVFGKIDGELHFRSKGKEIFIETADKMFAPSVEYILNIQEKLPDNVTFYTEMLNKPRHNILEYGTIPKNRLALFGMSTNLDSKFFSAHSQLEIWANILEIDVVPKIYYGIIDSFDHLMSFMDRESYLGKINIEGLVAKNYYRPFLLGGQPMPLMAGKLVSEAFKEVHHNSWGKENTSKGKWESFVEGYRTDARWNKSIQHLAEKGELENSPRDIGKLIKEIHSDISEEEKDTIKEFLWKEFGGQLLRRSTAGFPEWYKDMLAKRSFKNE